MEPSETTFLLYKSHYRFLPIAAIFYLIHHVNGNSHCIHIHWNKPVKSLHVSSYPENELESMTNFQWRKPWWRHQMEIFSALLALGEGNSPVTGDFSSQRPVELWWSAPEQTVGQTIDTLVIWDAIWPITTSLQCQKFTEIEIAKRVLFHELCWIHDMKCNKQGNIQYTYPKGVLAAILWKGVWLITEWKVTPHIPRERISHFLASLLFTIFHLPSNACVSLHILQWFE